MKLPFVLALTYIVPAPNSVAAFAVVGMKEKTVFAETLEFKTVVVPAFAVKVTVPVFSRFPRLI